MEAITIKTSSKQYPVFIGETGDSQIAGIYSK